MIFVQLQDEDDGDDETSSKDFMELIHLTRRHISEVARLEGLREVEVEVSDTTHKELVLLPSGLRVRAPALCEDGELLWSPPGARTEAKVVESTESVHGDNITPGQCPWRGRSRAFLFDSWESVGQGRGSSNIQEMWPGGARRWLCVTKLNTTTECRCSGWTGHLCGSGAARELGPSSSTRRVM